jgi:hypothetical protein
VLPATTAGRPNGRAAVDLAEELYPDRSLYRSGERPEAIDDLQMWVKGGTFHKYGQPAHEHEDYDWNVKPTLQFVGELIDGSMRWRVFYQRFGVPGNDGWGASSGYSHPADAAYGALHLIEEHERETWLERLVIGIA